MPDEIKEEGLEDRVRTLGDIIGIQAELIILIRASVQGPAAEAVAWQDLGACGREKMQRIREILTLLKKNPEMREFVLFGRKVKKERYRNALTGEETDEEPEPGEYPLGAIADGSFQALVRTLLQQTPSGEGGGFPLFNSETEDDDGPITSYEQFQRALNRLGPGIRGFPVYRPKDRPDLNIYQQQIERLREHRARRDTLIKWLMALLPFIVAAAIAIVIFHMAGVI